MYRSIPVYFGLGSNIGDRSANLEQAERRMDAALGVCARAKSRTLSTPARGFEGEDFLNCVLRYDLPADIFPRTLPRPIPASAPLPVTPAEMSESQALGLLDTVKRIETEMGRVQNVEFDASGRRIYHSRIIDIDILFIGLQRFALSRLSVPHPLMAERDFVMIPLREIASTELVGAFPEVFKNAQGRLPVNF